MSFYEEYEEPEKYHKCSHDGFFYPESEMTLIKLGRNVSIWIFNENLNQYKLNNNENNKRNNKKTNC